MIYKVLSAFQFSFFCFISLPPPFFFFRLQYLNASFVILPLFSSCLVQLQEPSISSSIVATLLPLSELRKAVLSHVKSWAFKVASYLSDSVDLHAIFPTDHCQALATLDSLDFVFLTLSVCTKTFSSAKLC